MRTRVTNMSNPQTEPRRLPVFKLLGIITLLIICTVYLVSWLSRSELLYAYDTVETKAVIVKSPVLDDPGQMFVALNYTACPSTTESIHLGKQELDPKAPQRLREIRECLGKLALGTEVPVQITTRRQRMSNTKAGKITLVGTCKLPLLPTRINLKDGERCDWM